MNKKSEDLEEYLKFVEDHKLWQDPYMKEPGGMDPVNKGNFYFFMENFNKCAENYGLASRNLGSTTMPRVFFGNLSKGIKAFKNIEDYAGLMDLLVGSKKYLKTNDDLSAKTTKRQLLYVNYQIAKLSHEHKINKEEGEQALAYCKTNYKQNSVFTEEDLDALQ